MLDSSFTGAFPSLQAFLASTGKPGRRGTRNDTK